MMVFKHSCVSTFLFNVCSKHGTCWFVFCLYIYFVYVCVCVFVSCNTTFLFDYHAHSLNPEKTTCLCNSFTQTGLISSGYDARRSLNIPNSPHYRFFFWTISRFKAHVLTKKRDNSHKNKFCNKIIFFSLIRKPPTNHFRFQKQFDSQNFEYYQNAFTWS